MIQLIMQEFNDDDIARAMGIAKCTVRTYITTLFRKFGVRTRQGIVVAVLVANSDTSS